MSKTTDTTYRIVVQEVETYERPTRYSEGDMERAERTKVAFQYEARSLDFRKLAALVTDDRDKAEPGPGA